MKSTTTNTPASDTGHAPSTLPRHVAGAAAVALGAALFVTVASVDVPLRADDIELLGWWQNADNRSAGLVSAGAALVVAIAYPMASNYISLTAAASQSPHWRAFTRSMVGAVTAMWLVIGAIRATVGHVVEVMGEPLPSLDALRLITAVNYALLDISGMAVLAVSLLAHSVLIWRTRALHPWVAYVGLACALIIVAAVLVGYGAYTTPLAIGWALCLAIAIWLRRGKPSSVR